jgi:hypothetical protein
VARLDAIALDLSDTVDLNDVAADVVTAMAPWALTHCRTIAFADAKMPVRIKGNANAIEDAVRNLVENAVAHSPAGRRSQWSPNLKEASVLPTAVQAFGLTSEKRYSNVSGAERTRLAMGLGLDWPL